MSTMDIPRAPRAPGVVSPSTTLWEYHVENFARYGADLAALTGALDALGNEGWELVSAFEISGQTIHFVFKREQPNKPTPT